MVELRWACEASTTTREPTLQYREYEVIDENTIKIVRDWTDVPRVVVSAPDGWR